MRIHVDDTEVEVAQDATVLDAVREAGKALPTLCHDERLTAAGSCRLCLVRQGTALVAACTSLAADGAHVEVDSAELRDLRQDTLRLIVSALPPRALDRPAEHNELVQACAELGVDPAAAVATGGRGMDDSHPYVHLDRDLCIACGRCVRMCSEVQGTFALTLVDRGAGTVVAPGTGGAWADSDCVSCGGCVDTCPTDALFETGLADSRLVERSTRTTCGYCGVGCQLDILTRDGEIAAALPSIDGPVNHGHACVKGRFAHGFVVSPERLTTPMLRIGGHLQPVSWEHALDYAAGELHSIRARQGPDAIAAISSARATNEENYLVQKFMRAGIGTNNVDNCARLCHAPSAAGLAASFGYAGGTDSFDDVEQADCFFVVGANPTEAHPVVGARLLQRALRGARLIVADPREVGLAQYADVHLRPRPGTNVALFHGIAHVLLAEGLIDPDFLDARATGLDGLIALVADYPPERVENITGVPAADVVRAARLYGNAEAPAIIYGLGVTEHLHGTDGVRTLANLAILCGAIGTERGFGINPLRGQNNVQGASDMGALPDKLPGYANVSDQAARARFEQAWGVRLPRTPGMRIPDMFRTARAGDLGALWVIGEDVASTDPDSSRVLKALRSSRFLMVSELFLSQTAREAHLVLPAASWLEKDGTFVNFDRRFQRVRAAVEPPGGARTDFAIVQGLARAFGADLGCPTPADALDEVARLVPLFGGISHQRLDTVGALHWPCPSPEHPGRASLYEDRFATPDGRARLAVLPYLPAGEQPDDDYPLLLITGRRWAHYNSGTMTRRTPNLQLTAEELLDIHPDDASRYDITDGFPVELASRHGKAVLPARVTKEVGVGQLFTSFHFTDAGVNHLTSGHEDTATGCPEYKVTALRIRRRA